MTDPRKWAGWLACCAATLALPSHAAIEKDFADLTLEELMNETVTSVSKRAQRLSDAAAAITVLSNDDIRSSGFTSIADALRLVPGMNVGSVTSSQWSVSARGFNNLYANKLLVLVDGRAVYSPLFAGVYWDAEQTMLEDVDRVEVIRGPGATVWGANAVNGVINVVTRSAKDTQGGLLYGSVGDVLETNSGVRYGGQLSSKTYYRVFASTLLKDDYRLPNGQSAGDGWRGQHGGFRVDHHPIEDTQMTFQAATTDVESDDDLINGQNWHTLGRVERTWSDRSSFEVQGYFDRSVRDEAARSSIQTDTFDLNAQHVFGIGERNDVIWGLGYRVIENKITETSPLLGVRDGDVSTQLFSVFVQNEFKLIPDKVALTAGVKVEHNDYTGVEIQPSVRGTYKPTEYQTVWAAVSRAVRTPAGIEGKDIFEVAFGTPFVGGPDAGLYLPRVVGGDDLRSEVLWAYELGYRVHPTKRISLDVAVFYNQYTDLISTGGVTAFIPGAPGTAEIPFTNNLEGHTYGGEISMTVAPTDTWRLLAGYSLLIAEVNGPTLGNPKTLEQGSPRNQVILRSSHDFGSRVSVDAQLRYVDAIQFVPSYLTADVRFSYRVNDRLALALVGQNLLQDQHAEQGPGFYITPTEVPRSFFGQLTLRF